MNAHATQRYDIELSLKRITGIAPSIRVVEHPSNKAREFLGAVLGQQGAGQTDFWEWGE